MRTTLNIDDALLGRAKALTGIREKTSVVRARPKALIARDTARRLAALDGSDGSGTRRPQAPFAGAVT